MNKIYTALSLTLLFLICTGCDKENSDTQEEEAYLKLSGYTVKIADGQAAQLQIYYTTNMSEIEITVDELATQWCSATLEPQYIELKIEESPSTELERSAIVEVTANAEDQESITKNITITQAPHISI